jgi:hypothetical protein
MISDCKMVFQLTYPRSKLDYLDWYAYKGTVREYLKAINKDKKVRWEKSMDVLVALLTSLGS